jgi:hypothetical protein
MERRLTAGNNPAGTVFDQKPDIVVFVIVLEDNHVAREFLLDHPAYPIPLPIHPFGLYRELRKCRVNLRTHFRRNSDSFFSNSS